MLPFTSARVPISRVSLVSQRQGVCLAAVAQAEPAAAAPAPAAATGTYHPSPLSQAPPALYAIVEVGGHQMFVEPGKWYTCNRLKADVGSTIKFGRVLAIKSGPKLTVGMPYLETVNVEAEVQEELRGPKIIVYKMKSKKHYRRKQGHRQELSKFRVTKIEA